MDPPSFAKLCMLWQNNTPRQQRRKFDFHDLGFGRGWVGVEGGGNEAPLATGTGRFALVDSERNLVEDRVAVVLVSEGFLDLDAKHHAH